MKHIINITITSLLFIIILSSCDNSMGYESNYSRRIIDKDTSNTPPPTKVTRFPVDSVLYYFSEHFYWTYPNNQERVPVMSVWDITHYTIKGEMDTSAKNWSLWLNMKLENNLNQADIKFRNDYISEIQLKIDSLTFNRIPSFSEAITISLNSSQNDGRFSLINIKRLPSGEIVKFSELQSRLNIRLRHTFGFVEESGVKDIRPFIEVFAWADFTDNDKIQTFRLEGYIYIFYD